MCVIGTVEVEVCSPSVSVLYVVRLRIVFSKAALQKRGSMEPMEPPLDLPLYWPLVCLYLQEGIVHQMCM